MSKAVMISIQPWWCELIAKGMKTVEVRKTRPKLEPPFKCYIYCTANKKGLHDELEIPSVNGSVYIANGKVIGEFVCDEIRTEWEVADGLVDIVLEMQSCVDCKELIEYADGKKLYSWNISNLVIYDKPKELSEFYRECPGVDDVGLCYECEKAVGDEFDCGIHHELHLTRPPQSWCYVEEV